MFERTLGLVKRYRRLLDQGRPSPPQEKEDSSKPVSGVPSSDEPSSTITEKIQLAKDSLTGSGGSHEPKVIFATGGITNGKQALEILNAGASVAQIYTALSTYT
jgi:dihydroorotate dehydrogenase